MRDEDEARATWRAIRGLAHAIASDPVMAPTPSTLCTWCDYYGNGCVLDRPQPGARPGEDPLATWLDEERGAAPDGGATG